MVFKMSKFQLSIREISIGNPPREHNLWILRIAVKMQNSQFANYAQGVKISEVLPMEISRIEFWNLYLSENIFVTIWKQFEVKYLSFLQIPRVQIWVQNYKFPSPDFGTLYIANQGRCYQIQKQGIENLISFITRTHQHGQATDWNACLNENRSPKFWNWNPNSQLTFIFRLTFFWEKPSTSEMPD